jgi:hypothetical protein
MSRFYADEHSLEPEQWVNVYQDQYGRAVFFMTAQVKEVTGADYDLAELLLEPIANCPYCNDTGKMMQHLYDYRTEAGYELNPRDIETACIACTDDQDCSRGY